MGFASAEQAAAAVKYFNRTFMDAMRLEVEYAYKYGAGQEKGKAWSKYTEGTSANHRQKTATGANDTAIGPAKEKTAKKTKAPKPEEEDPKLRAFMELMQPRSKKAIWANDDAGLTDIPTAPGTDANPSARGAEQLALEDGHGSDDDLYEDVPGSSDDGSSSSGEESDDKDGEEGAQRDPVVADAGVSDMDYLKARMKKSFSDSEEEGGEEAANEDSDEDEESEHLDAGGESGSDGDLDEAEAEAGDHPAKSGREEPGSDDEIDALFHGQRGRQPLQQGGEGADDEAGRQGMGAQIGRREQQPADAATLIQDTGRLFVRNLPYTAGESDLRTAFEAYGEVESVHIVLDKATRRSKGYAMIQFANPHDAVAAHEALDGSIFMGRLMHVLPGQRAPQAEAPEGEEEPLRGGTSSYKRKKEAELKASAGNRAAWNSLFMRADTVAEAVAAHYGVSKAELLDPQAKDMAVRLALGETQVIAQTKASLADEGVNVQALEEAAAASGKGRGGAGKRNDRVLLVKNLPFSTNQSELEALFASAGPVSRLALPSTHTLALVEFVEPQDARRAFKALAYKRYQSVPLYLEWAPENIFSGGPRKQASAAQPPHPVEPTAAAKAEPERAEDVAAALTAVGATDDAVDSSTVYVKNLAFATEEAALLEHFAAEAEAAGGSVRSVKVARRKGKDGRMLSAGFGFVECSSESVARAVIAKRQGSSLDGHRLVLQLAQQQKAASAAQDGSKKGKGALATPTGQESTKIVVRNVAFEATRKDILGLFTPFGQVKSCRLPRKFDGTHRGFAFVEFATREEARSAVDAVAGAHLYGRRLVIEWAAEDGGLDELRAKTAVKYRGDASALAAAEGGGEEAEGAVEDEPAGRRKRRKKG